MVEEAAALPFWCIEPSASVSTGQEAVIANPASISPVASASQAPVALWVNISTMIASGFETRRHSSKMRCMRAR